MATHESNRGDLAFDLTPEIATLEGKRNLVTLSPDATARDMIAMADAMAMELSELVDEWPSERPMPLALINGIRRLQQLLCHMENSTRGLKGSAA
jgi:hypothetical protein